MTQDIWTSLEAERMGSAMSDPLGGMTASEIMSSTVRNFPAAAFTEPTIVSPSQPWLTTMAAPAPSFTDHLISPARKFVESSYERLPDLLWGYGLERAGIIDRPKKQVVDEGAGVIVTHVQPPHAGGEPANPLQILLPQIFPTSQAAGPPQAKDMNTVLWIGLGLGVLYLLIGRN